MRKKTLILAKEVIADLSRNEMYQLVGGGEKRTESCQPGPCGPDPNNPSSESVIAICEKSDNTKCG